MVVDHDIYLYMDSMPISKFKATCLAALERVRRTGRPLRVTRFGTPVADICPPTIAPEATRRLGGMAEKMKIVGDIVHTPVEPWESLGR